MPYANPPLIKSVLRLSFALGAMGCVWATSDARAQDAYGPNRYTVTNLVSDLPGKAAATDPNLVNPWGIATFPTDAFWISSNGAGLSTLYDGAGHVIPVAFKIPPAAGQTTPASPTGIVYNPVPGGFLVPGSKLAAQYIFATEDGTISAWAPSLPTNPLSAVLAVDHSKVGAGAVYKGLEFGTTQAGAFLYATNFRSGRIDVYDSTFAPAEAKLTGSFTDPQLPPGYAPFGIRNLDGNLYVTYARQDAVRHDDVKGYGHGFVDVFDTNGHLLQHFAARGALDSPWAIARAPEGFGPLSGLILVGNFGDGRINAFDSDGRLRGPVLGRNAQPLQIDGLWGLDFGSGAASANPRTLYFTAGPEHEQHGLFGEITP